MCILVCKMLCCGAAGKLCRPQQQLLGLLTCRSGATLQMLHDCLAENLQIQDRAQTRPSPGHGQAVKQADAPGCGWEVLASWASWGHICWAC